jgi:Spy/CpxP family protein refolding chaperone
MSLSLVVLLLAVFSIPGLYARECSHGKKEGQGYDFGRRVLGKMHLAMMHQEELALSEDQYQKIQTLKTDTKKDLVKRKAEIDLLAIDMKSKLSEDTIDVEGINKLIDQKYELKKAKAKALVEVCVTFKGILTDEQKQKLKKICPKGHKK